MPSDVLLPLFVLTLLANAILVAFAIRGMRRGQWDDDRPIGVPPPPPAGSSPGGSLDRAESSVADDGRGRRDEIARAELARAIAARRPREGTPAGAPRPVAPPPAVVAEPPSAVPVGQAAADSHRPAAKAARAAKKPAPTAKPRRTTKPAAGGDASAATSDAPPARSAGGEPRRGRRRFSLPPLDDDHEKVNRSIKSFLGGIEGASAADDVPDPPTADAPSQGAPTAGPTTVALIAVDGLPAEPAGDAPQPAPVTEALAMVERTLRAAARGSDVVTLGGRGRFRIVLPATGELAARAYLRRIRATIEPRLESTSRPLRLAVAMATVLDEPLEYAVQRAEDRLAIALTSDRSPEGGTPPPRRSEGSDDATAHVPTAPRAAATDR